MLNQHRRTDDANHEPEMVDLSGVWDELIATPTLIDMRIDDLSITYRYLCQDVVVRDYNWTVCKLKDIFNNFQQTHYPLAEMQQKFTAFCAERYIRIRHSYCDYRSSPALSINQTLWIVTQHLFPNRNVIQQLQVLIPGLTNIVMVDVEAKFNDTASQSASKHDLFVTLSMCAINKTDTACTPDCSVLSLTSLVQQYAISDDAVLNLEQIALFNFTLLQQFYYQLDKMPELRQQLFGRNDTLQAIELDLVSMSRQLYTPRHILSTFCRQLEASGERIHGLDYATNGAITAQMTLQGYLESLPDAQRRLILACTATRKILGSSKENTTVEDVFNFLEDTDGNQCVEVASACLRAICNNPENTAVLDTNATGESKVTFRERNQHYHRESVLTAAIARPQDSSTTQLPICYLRSAYDELSITSTNELITFLSPLPTHAVLNALISIDIRAPDIIENLPPILDWLVFLRVREPFCAYLQHTDCAFDRFTRAGLLFAYGKHDEAVTICRQITDLDYMTELATTYQTNGGKTEDASHWKAMIHLLSHTCEEQCLIDYVTTLSDNTLNILLAVKSLDSFLMDKLFFDNALYSQSFIKVVIPRLTTANAVATFLAQGVMSDSIYLYDRVSETFSFPIIIGAHGVPFFISVLRSFDEMYNEHIFHPDDLGDLLQGTADTGDILLQYLTQSSMLEPSRMHALRFSKSWKAYTLHTFLSFHNLDNYPEAELTYILKLLQQIKSFFNTPPSISFSHDARTVTRGYKITDANRALMLSLSGLHDKITQNEVVALDDFTYAIMLKAYADTGELYQASHANVVKDILKTCIRKNYKMILFALSVSMPSCYYRALQVHHEVQQHLQPKFIEENFHLSPDLFFALRFYRSDEFTELLSNVRIIKKIYLPKDFVKVAFSAILGSIDSDNERDNFLSNIKYYLYYLVKTRADLNCVVHCLDGIFDSPDQFQALLDSDEVSTAAAYIVPEALDQLVHVEKHTIAMRNFWFGLTATNLDMKKNISKMVDAFGFAKVRHFLLTSGALAPQTIIVVMFPDKFRRIIRNIALALCFFEEKYKSPLQPLCGLLQQRYDAFMAYQAIDEKYDALYTIMLCQMEVSELCAFLEKAPNTTPSFIEQLAAQCPITISMLANLMHSHDFITLIKRHKLEYYPAVLPVHWYNKNKELLSAAKNTYPRFAIAMVHYKDINILTAIAPVSDGAKRCILATLYQQLSLTPTTRPSSLFYQSSASCLRSIIRYVENDTPCSLHDLFDKLCGLTTPCEAEDDDTLAQRPLTYDMIENIISTLVGYIKGNQAEIELLSTKQTNNILCAN